MAYGKMIWTPRQTQALYLDGSHYLELPEQPNLIETNPGFEDGDLTGWIGATGVTVSAGSAYSGTYKATIPIEKVISTDQTINLLRGVKYKLIVALKGVGDDLAPLISIIDQYGKFAMSSDQDEFALTANWQIWSINFTATQNYQNCVIQIANAAGGNLYVDDVSLSVEYLDYGIDDFTIDLLHCPLATTGNICLARKCSDALSTTGIGWQLYHDSAGVYRLALNDGGGQVVIASSAITQLQNLLYHWVRVVVSRTNNLVSFYVDGVAKGSGSIAAVTGSISSDQPLRLFAWDSGTALYKGFCDFIRFTRTPIPNATWMASEWASIQYGCLRQCFDNGALWEFEEDLIDQSANHLLLNYLPGDDPTYEDGWPYADGEVGYTFSHNYNYGHQESYIDMPDRGRTLDGQAWQYAPIQDKRSYILPFTTLTAAQINILNAAYLAHTPIQFYLDADLPKTADVYITAPPQRTSQPYFRIGAFVSDISLSLEEI